MRGLSIIIILVILFSAGSALASEEVFEIQQLDPNFPIQKLQTPGVRIHKWKATKRADSFLPSRSKKYELFRRSQLSEDVANWDTYQKDSLILDAWNLDETDLQKTYPQLNKEKLKQLQINVLKARKQRSNNE